jgi:hypothetical protein
MSTTARVQLASIVGLEIAPPRVRRFLDQKGLNSVVEVDINRYKDAILAIEKEGAAPRPTPPTKPTVEGDAAVPQRVLDAYNAEHQVYAAAYAVWKNFKSARYTALSDVYEVAKDLTKLQNLLEKQTAVSGGDATNKKKFTPKNASEVASLQASLATHTTLVGKADLTSSESVAAQVQTLNTANPDLASFFHRDSSSASRVRFNDRATVALATVMEAMVEQLAEHSMNEAIRVGKKIIQPKHCVTESLEECSLYPLFNNLPAMRAVRDRKARELAYQTQTKQVQAEATLKAKAAARKNKKTFKSVKLDQPSFEQTEVDAGYAVYSEVEPAEAAHEGEDAKEAKMVCQWYGIDIPSRDTEAVDTTDFVHYTNEVCKNVRNNAVTDGNAACADLRISTALKNFFSDILIQFVARMLPLIILTIASKKKAKKNDVKTVGDQVVVRVIEILLADSNHNAQGLVTFTQEHQALFTTIQEKLALLDAHCAEKAARKHGKDEEVEDDGEDVDAEAEPTPTPVETPAPTPAPVEVPAPSEPAASDRSKRRQKK